MVMTFACFNVKIYVKCYVQIVASDFSAFVVNIFFATRTTTTTTLHLFNGFFFQDNLGKPTPER